MPKGKPLHLFTFFCSVCKEHIEVHAEDKKQAEGKFGAQGHEYVKTNRLRRGLPGVLLSQNQAEAKAGKEKKKKRGSKVVAMNEEEVLGHGT